MSAAIDDSAVHLNLIPSLIAELGDDHGRFRTTAERRGPAVVIYAGGQVDAYNEHAWRRLLAAAAAAATAPGPVVIATDGLDFMGCCAFSALAEQADRCRSRNIGLCLVSHAPIVARVIAAGGLGSRLPIYPDLDSALAASWRPAGSN